MNKCILHVGLLLAIVGCSAAETSAEATSELRTCSAGEEPIEAHNAIGTLHGTLSLPEGCGAHPVVLILPGSGAVDREGGAPRPYKILADDLAKVGIGSLRYDKAGVGESAGAFPASAADFRFAMGADDAAKFLVPLRGDSRVGKIVLAGHSEGSMLALLIANQADGYVSLAGAGRPIGTVLREQLAHNISDAALLARANEIVTSLEHGETVSDVPQELAMLFRPPVQPYLISWMSYDPPAVFAELRLPSLIIQGTTDIQISLTDSDLLAAARPDAQYLKIDGMNHVLKVADLTPASQNDAYTNPDKPLAPELVPAIARFVNGL